MKTLRGAGVIPLADSTGRFLLGLRPDGLWSGFGGRFEPEDENLQMTAAREFFEETGYEGTAVLAPIVDLRRKGLSRLYLALIPEEFAPQLSDEHVMARWFVVPPPKDQLHWTVRPVLPPAPRLL